MDLEFHQLDLRYEELRSRSPALERRLLSSLAEVGQQTPIVVVSAAEAPQQVVIDGYKRVRLLRRLGQDVVRATAWDLSEADALLLERMLRAGDADSALEQGWFLRELRDRFQLSGRELGQRFGRTESWVSRRLALVAELPEAVQRHVRAGGIGAHVAMKYLVPLARANRVDAERLADAVAPLRLPSRQMAVVYAAWSGSNLQTRELLLKDPSLVLRGLPADASWRAAGVARAGAGGARSCLLADAPGVDAAAEAIGEGAGRCSTRAPEKRSCGCMRRVTGRAGSRARSASRAGPCRMSSRAGAPKCRRCRVPRKPSRTGSRSSSSSLGAKAIWCACTRSSWLLARRSPTRH
jgi:ParB-like chromosome segregation protein Spo0J